MSAAHAQSPFEDPASYTAAAMTVEEPAGFHIETAPLVAEVPVPFEEESPFAEPEPEPAAEVFAPALSEAEVPAEPVYAANDVTNTITMGDLYARQGLVDDARKIYENILDRDPNNEDVREKLSALNAAAPASQQPSGKAAKVAKLQDWLAKVKHV
jgi:hypothetical protein